MTSTPSDVVPPVDSPRRRRLRRLAWAALALALVGAVASVMIAFWAWPGGMASRDGSSWPDWGGPALALLAPLGLIGLATLITRAERADALEAEQRRAQRRAATLELIDVLPQAVALWDPRHGRITPNLAMAHLLRIDRDHAPAQPLTWQACVAPEDWPAWAEATRSALETGGTRWLRCTLRLADALRPVLAQMAAVPGEDGPVLAVCVTPQEDEAGLAQEAVLQLRDLLEIAEAEKWRFGQAVHDELGQRLAGMAFFAMTLQRKLEAAQRSEAEDAGWLTGLANEAIAAARNLAQGLNPVGSGDPAALEAALADVCGVAGKTFGIACSLTMDARFESGGAAQASHLYHVVQELVTNACKHGDARRVEIELSIDGTRQRVTVRNDGSPLPEPAPRRGMGLNGVRSRAAYLGGRFALANDGRGGVLATIELPRPAEHGATPP